MVIRADILGYCMGVRRAVDLVEKALSDYPDHDVYTLGSLIHNKTALEILAKKGMKTLEPHCIDSIGNGNKTRKQSVVIIRAHGAAPAVRKQLENAGTIVIDATCPRVVVNQKRTTDYTAKGSIVFIAGDKKHGEVVALSGSATPQKNCFVLQNADEAYALIKKNNFTHTAAVLISQTTITQDEYDAVRDALRSVKQDIHVFNTICPATVERQSALKLLCAQVDGVLVIGGKDSANTQRLYQTALQLCKNAPNNAGHIKPVAHIETAAEIPPHFFTLAQVGITAGASTPDEVIDEVENILAKGRTQ